MLTIITCTWQRDLSLLARSLATWRGQAEIIVVDLNADEAKKQEVKTLCEDFLYVSVPLAQFHLSRALNIGIKQSRTKYVLCTGAEIMFSRGYMATLESRMEPDRMAIAPCGTLPEGTKVPNDPHADWQRLVDAVDPHSPRQVSPGTYQCAARDWWFKVHGYDEGQYFAWVDSDIIRRAKLDDLGRTTMKWDEGQAVHQWHEPSPLIHTLPGRWIDDLQADTTIVRNLDGWGEIP